MRRGAALAKLVAALAGITVLAVACSSARQQAPQQAQQPTPQPTPQPAQQPAAQPSQQPAPQPAQQPAAQPAQQPAAQPLQANPKKALQAQALVEAVKSYYAATHCYPEMAPGGQGMPPALGKYLHVPWPSGFVYETDTRELGWQAGKGTVYYIDIYYPGDVPGWLAPGSGRVYIVKNEAAQTC